MYNRCGMAHYAIKLIVSVMCKHRYMYTTGKIHKKFWNCLCLILSFFFFVSCAHAPLVAGRAANRGESCDKKTESFTDVLTVSIYTAKISEISASVWCFFVVVVTDETSKCEKNQLYFLIITIVFGVFSNTFYYIILVETEYY